MSSWYIIVNQPQIVFRHMYMAMVILPFVRTCTGKKQLVHEFMNETFEKLMAVFYNFNIIPGFKAQEICLPIFVGKLYKCKDIY